ncbi:MAG: hypothetical protein QXV95_02780 [Sulfolobales archaeon]
MVPLIVAIPSIAVPPVFLRHLPVFVDRILWWLHFVFLLVYVDKGFSISAYTHRLGLRYC